jgi:hypothetical protein
MAAPGARTAAQRAADIAIPAVTARLRGMPLVLVRRVNIVLLILCGFD